MRTMTVALPRGKAIADHGDALQEHDARLKSKGGSLKITAQTALSSLPSATRTLKVKRLKTGKKAVR